MPELASFRADDPDVLVEAALSCPWCLRRTVLVALEGEPAEAHARCFCQRCQTERIVELLPEQHLRLLLAGAATT